MRHSIIYYLAGFLLVTVLVVGVVYVGASDEVSRYHQHREQASEADLGECHTCTGGVLCTHLPILIVDTFGAEIPGRPLAFGTGRYGDLETLSTFHTAPGGETEIEVSVSVIESPGNWNHPGDVPALESLAMMRLRGNSSRMFDKPNYRINLVHPDREDNPLPLLGMEPHSEWALHGPFLDKTLMRNYVWMNLAAEVMGPGHFVPNVRFFELILNGEYQGLYVLMETVRVSQHRVGLTRYREGLPVTSYLARLDTQSHVPERKVNIFAFYTYRLEGGNTLEILYPGLARQSDEIRDYVARSVSIVERLLYSPEILWDSRAYEQYLDVDSFVNFYILNEFLANNDMWSSSTYFHKDVRGRLVAGPVWDFNNVMDNFMRTIPVDSFILSHRGWFGRLLICPHFNERVIRRWNELRRGVLAEERLIGYMQEVEDWLGNAIDRNFEVWGYSFDPMQVSTLARRRATHAERAMGLTDFDLNPSSFEQAQEQARTYMVERGRFMDRYIETLRQFSHPSRHALWILP